MEGSRPPELSLTGRNATAEAVTSRVYFVIEYNISSIRLVHFRAAAVDHSMALHAIDVMMQHRGGRASDQILSFLSVTLFCISFIFNTSHTSTNPLQRRRRDRRPVPLRQLDSYNKMIPRRS
ncbi:hypothetical protein EVAR_10636_1 [Eumeta japonica]|uniref:Uncharacterized protein n=1 Tax=Eumeta variegata TaxID=151549 RepID=A0A4C1U7Q0_EUMVA|nr:hypothetical protein EVAR_10636_1 [Eumeta japonica]